MDCSSQVLRILVEQNFKPPTLNFKPLNFGMTENDLIKMRLQNQHLLNQSLTSTADIVRSLGAVQAQDYAGAKWSLATRSTGITEEEIDKSFDAGHILRTHVLRPTWHFVLPDDIRWMLKLTEPRITAFSSKYFRDAGLDETVFKKTNRVIVKALEKEGFLTKKEIADALQRTGIDTQELRLTYIIIRAELDQLICSGPRRGKQMTYALMDHRAPNARVLKKDEALSELAIRYFKSRGPATVKDFGWWSGLSAGDSRKAVEIVSTNLVKSELNEVTYYFISSKEGNDIPKQMRVHLLPSWDEYTVAYKDRSLVIEQKFQSESGHGIFSPIIVVDGKVKGVWRRELKTSSVDIEIRYFGPLSKSIREKINATARLYAKYLNRKLNVAELKEQ